MRFRASTRRSLLQGAATAAAVAAVPRLGGARAQAATDTLRVRSYSDLQVLDPLNRLAQPEGDIMDAIYSNLAKAKPGESWAWELDAAEELTQIDDRHIRFRLRPGIRFSGGFGEMTAEDVKFSFERIADPKNESPYRDDWVVLDRVEVEGPLAGTIVLKEPFAPLWTISLVRGSGSIMSKKAVEAAGGRFTTRPPAMSGAYLLESWTPKQKTVLVRNPDHYGPAPAFARIEIMPIDDEKTAELAFEAGELDFTTLSLSSLPDLQTSPPAGAKLVERPSLAYVWLGMNTENEALADLRVRQAVRKAVDVDAVLEAAYFGVAARANGIIAPGLVGHREVTPPARDLEGAMALLEEAGVSSLALTLDILNKAERVAAAQVIQANLAEAGVEVEIRPHDSGTFWTLGDEKAGESWKGIQLVLNRFSMQPDPSFATTWFTPEQVGVWNWERWRNPEFGELHRKAIAELDPAKRQAMYARMQDLMDESGAYLVLTHELTAAIHKETLVPGLLPDGNVRFGAFGIA